MVPHIRHHGYFFNFQLDGRHTYDVTLSHCHTHRQAEAEADDRRSIDSSDTKRTRLAGYV